MVRERKGSCLCSPPPRLMASPLLAPAVLHPFSSTEALRLARGILASQEFTGSAPWSLRAAGGAGAI